MDVLICRLDTLLMKGYGSLLNLNNMHDTTPFVPTYDEVCNCGAF